MFNPIKKLLNKQEYYLELDEAEAGKKADSKAPAKKPEPAKAKSAKPAKKQKSTKAKSAEPAKEPEAVQAILTPEQLIQAAVTSTKNGKVETQPEAESQPEAEQTFADKNLLPLPTSRRRPGPSMNMFRDMARGVKTPK
ncbi:MAG: hypothetical protein F6K31_07160 [Symploca sp. SIO2G7]|nr:hypothetical protein [Symploca sp. SIO2G7]